MGDSLREERAIVSRLLRLGSSSNGLHDLLHEATSLLSEWSGCQAVGVRLRDGDDFPYYETRGFPREFILAESSLCRRGPDGQVARDFKGNPVLECMCGNILSGRFDPAKPFFTAGGSFWTNSTSKLLATTTEEDRQTRTRNRCNGEGYESVALIPLRSGETVFGLLQLNDRRAGRFTSELILLIEALAGALAEAMAHRLATEEVRRSREQLQRERDAARQYLEIAAVGIVGINAERKVTLVNRRMCQILECDEDEIVGADWFERFLPEACREKAATVFAGIMSGDAQGLRRAENVVLSKSGKERLIAWHNAPLTDDSGRIVGALSSGEDITERRADEQRIAQMEMQLSHASRLATLGEMAAGIAHEVNQPLCAIVNFAKACKNAASSNDADLSKIRQLSETIATTAARSGEIVRRLLRFSRMQSPTRETVTGAQLTADAMLLVRHEARSRKIAVELDPRSAEVSLRVDPVQIQQVLVNLLRNAIEALGAVPSGKGRVAVRWQATEADVLVSVSDNGPGLSGLEMQRMFDPFVSSKQQGLGLGLPISKTFVEEHGGIIWADSNADHGLTVFFTLPAAKDVSQHASG